MLRGTNGTSDKVELLRRVALFADCSKTDLVKIAGRCRETHAASGATIVAQGTRGDRFFVLAEGLAYVHVDGRKVASIGAGSFFGEMALIEHEVRSASVTAELPCRLLVVEEKDFDAVRSVPCVADKVMRGMSARLRAANHPTTA